MEIHKISLQNTHLLKHFISSSLPLSFRYFNKHTFKDCLLNHIVTIVGTVDNIPIAYGHIDKGNEKQWLGICVLPNYQGKGFGKQIMNYLLNETRDTIYLTVDTDNIVAQKLYIKFDFNIISSKDTHYVMKRQSNSLIYLPVSLGEALDKLTILDIKLDKIRDKRKEDVQKEYNILYDQLKDQIQEHNFHYDILKNINLNIWDMQDLFRESKDENEKNGLCMEIIDENDRRFRVKNKINNICKSSIKEQKGYNKTKAFVLTHIDLGDNLTALGAIRYYSTIYDEVIVVCKKKNLNNVKSFYQDDNSIKFYTVNEVCEISPGFGFPMELFNIITKDCKVISCGMHCNQQIEEIPWSFYKHLNLRPNIFWDYFYVPTTNHSIILHNIVKNMNYVFIHNDCSKGKVFTLEDIEYKLNVNKNDILFINPNENMYDSNHSNYELANRFIGHLLLDYKLIIENAKYNILNESSFFCLAIQLNIKTDNNYYITRFTGNESEVIWDKYRYPSSKKRFRRI